MKKSFVSIVFLSIFILIFFLTSFSSNAKEEYTQLKTKIDSLQTQVNDNTKDINNFKSKIHNIIFYAILANLSFWGIIIWTAGKTIKKITEKAIYKVDPTYLEVKIPSENFDNEAKRLKVLGFKNLKEYSILDDSCLSGCIICSVNNENQAATLKNFLEDKKPNEFKVGYVIYTRLRIEPIIFEKFDNITFANSPLTLVNAVYAVARGTIK